MATIIYQNQWCYNNTTEYTPLTSSGQPFCYVGRSGDAYYTYVVKLQTDNTILDPVITLQCAGTDKTGDTKFLSVKFVPCTASATPSTEYLGKAMDGDTRIRFGMKWQNSKWTSISNGGQGYTSGLVIPKGYFFIYVTYHSESTELYAQSTMRVWTATSDPPSITATDASKYTVNYNSNGGSGTMNSQTKYYNVSLTLSANSFTAPDGTKTTQIITLKRDGTTIDTKTTTNTTPKVFSKWNTNSTGTGISYNAGASYTDNADATMYAQWTNGAIEKESIVLGSTTKTPISSSLTLTLKLQDGFGMTYPLTKTTNYTFNSWNTEANGSGTKFDSTALYSFDTDAILYAIFDSSAVLPTVNLPTNIIRDGYTFKGWSTNSTGSPLISGNTYQPSSDTTLYAVWESSGIEDGMYVYQVSDQVWHKVASFTV